MATLGAQYPTLLDIAKATDPDGKIARQIEILTLAMPELEDMAVFQGNLETGHQSVVETSLPVAYFRLANAGIVPSKGSSVQITDKCAELASLSIVDASVARMNGNEADYRAMKARRHLQGMAQKMATTLWYGTASSPEEFIGFSARFSALSGAGNSDNVIGGGGVGADNTSVWLIGWGEDTINCRTPKGQPIGLKHTPFPIELFPDPNTSGAHFPAFRDWWEWKLGLHVADWRFAVRIPNLDVSNLVSKSGAADLVEKMMMAIERIPNLRSCRPVFYMNRVALQSLQIQRRDDVIAGGGLTFENVDGMQKYSFQGIPIHKTDALLNTEAVVS